MKFIKSVWVSVAENKSLREEKMQTTIYPGSALPWPTSSPNLQLDFQSTIILFDRAQEKPLQTLKFNLALENHSPLLL